MLDGDSSCLVLSCVAMMTVSPCSQVPAAKPGRTDRSTEAGASGKTASATMKGVLSDPVQVVSKEAMPVTLR